MLGLGLASLFDTLGLIGHHILRRLYPSLDIVSEFVACRPLLAYRNLDCLLSSQHYLPKLIQVLI